VVLPENTEHRRAILRRLLAGSQIVYPVMVWANLGGAPADFSGSRQLALAEDLHALGYNPRQRAGRTARSDQTNYYWVREETWPADVFGPMPYFGASLTAD
jgi:hypothetical protein